MAKSILVVDDSPSEMQFILRALSGRGYEFYTAVDGEQAIEKASRYLPDLILLDIVLPKKNGFQVCRQIRNTEPPVKTRIIMVSSKNQESDRFWGMKQGADGYLMKPFAPAELVAAVEKNL
jgi:twitching motility two-component system response regulator PilH